MNMSRWQRIRVAGIIISSLTALSAAQTSAGSPLGLEAYLQQVEGQSLGVNAAKLSSQGAKERAEESDLMTSPQAFSTVQFASDSRKSPFFRYDSVRNNMYSLGVQQQTALGLSWKLSYNLSYMDYQGLNFPGAATSFHEGRLNLEFNQPLWRNGFGAETRAMRDATEAQALVGHFSNRFALKAQLAEAESLYWQLSLARKTVKIAESTLERAKFIHEWNSRRSRLELADRSDLFQAEAALELRKLQLKGAQDTERSAARAFNTARNVSSDTVAEELVPPSMDSIQKMAPPARAPLRDDVLAAQQGERAAVAAAEQGKNRQKPTVDFFGTAGLNSSLGTLSEAISNSFTTTNPTLAAGLKLTVPLNFGSTASATEGWAREQAAAEKNYAQKVFQQDQEWADLSQKFQDAKARLVLADQIESIQKNKVLHERERLRQGRSITYQVILFEEDYSQAQLNRLRTEAEVLSLLARMKTFTGTEVK